jgi:hypothetical protein
LTPHGKAGKIAYALARGGELTNQQIKDLSGIQTLPGVYYLMDNLSTAIPIYQPRPGVWRILD